MNGYNGNIGCQAGAAAQNYIPPAPVKRPEVDTALDRLGDRVATLEGTLTDLVVRLQPVLRVVPQPGTESPASPVYNCAVAIRVGNQADRAEFLTNAIRDILDRLEV